MCDTDNFQKPNVYNKHLPFYNSIQRQVYESFEEIRMQLSRIIQLRELEPGFLVWSYKLQEFMLLYGYSFTKTDHLKLIDYYLSILSIDNLSFVCVKVCFDQLQELLRKTYLITRDELTIDWHLLYQWGKIIRFHHDQKYFPVAMPKDFEQSFFNCTLACRFYFSVTATQEILDVFRPWLCPFDTAFDDAMYFLAIFLPMRLPSDVHDQGFKLWFSELMGIWESITCKRSWEQEMICILSPLAWYNIGYIDWEPWISQIFTRFLNNLSLPVGTSSTSAKRNSYPISHIATWIVAMIGNRCSCLKHVRDLFTAMKNFYYPSNTGDFQQELLEFLSSLAQIFVNRIHQESKTDRHWHFQPHPSSRLTEEDITDFVNCLKECVFISIFNKTYLDDAAKAFRYLAMLRPELVIPPIVEQYFLSVDSMTEPHRFTSLLSCLTLSVSQIVSQTPNFPESQTYVIPLLMSVLPGIDSNDFDKTLVTFQFLQTMLMNMTCVDCSSAVNIRADLTQIEKEVCLSTAKFEDFISEFLNRTFQLIDNLSGEVSDVREDAPDEIETALTAVINGIVQQCSEKIFQVVRKKITNFLATSSFTRRISKLLTALIQPIVETNPLEILKDLLPQTCERIEKIIQDSEKTILIDYEGDIELTWLLVLFSKLLQARGDTLLVYKPIIFSVFHQCIHIVHTESYEALANAAKNLLKSLSHVYPIDYRLTLENIDEPFIDFLPIRAWGQCTDIDELKPQFHIPSSEEVDFACDFVETFLYPELTLLNEESSKMSKNERFRSLTLLHYICLGCLRMASSIDSEDVLDLEPSVAPFNSKYKTQYSLYAKEPKFQEDLRMRLITDIGKLLDHLVEQYPDETASISMALQLYSLPSCYYGLAADDCIKLWNDYEIVKYLFANKLKGKRYYPRFLMIKRLAKQIESFSTVNYQSFTEIDKQVIIKLFELSINRYSVIRSNAQVYLFIMLNRFVFSYQVIVNRLLELLSAPDQADHDQIKGCLYILLGDESSFLPTKHSWPVLEKLWPAIAQTIHATKSSTQELIGQITEGIVQEFETPLIIQDTNAISIRAAAALWRPLEAKEVETRDQAREQRNQVNIQSYHNLMEILNSAYHSGRLQVTWRQQKITIIFIFRLLQKRVPISTPCIRSIIDLLIHENVEVRKLASDCISTLCRLQKSPRIYVEKTLEEILHQPIVNNGHSGDRDDNLWVTINDYQPPKTQAEWEQSCFLDKSFYGYYQWPKIIKYPLNKRERYIRQTMPEQVAILYDRFIDKEFLAQSIRFMVLDKEQDNSFDEIRFRMFKGLFRNFGSVFVDNLMELLYALIREKIADKQTATEQVAAEIVSGMIRGSKYWTIEMLDEFWFKLTPFLNEVCPNLSSEAVYSWSTGFWHAAADVDPRRMYRFVEFLRSLMNIPSVANTFSETTRWHLVEQLSNFEWRIPGVWHAVHLHVKDLLDHSYKAIRERAASILSRIFYFDVSLPNGQATRHPSLNHFLDDIHERLQQAIDIYEKTPVAAISSTDIDLNTSQALNFIETVLEFWIKLVVSSVQPIKQGVIRLFPDLCNIESIVAHDETIQTHLVLARTYIAVSYVPISIIEALIEQIENVSTSYKWRARCAAIEFLQNMIFYNMFNARPFALRIREILLKYLLDEQLEVRSITSVTLAGLYQCGFIPLTKEDLKFFRMMSKTNYAIKLNGQKVASIENIVKRHAGILGLCAMVLSSPYEISVYIPDALMILCEHLHDPILIRESVKNTLSEFRRTHHDSWDIHREKFTEDQRAILSDVLVSPNYYV